MINTFTHRDRCATLAPRMGYLVDREIPRNIALSGLMASGSHPKTALELIRLFAMVYAIGAPITGVDFKDLTFF